MMMVIHQSWPVQLQDHPDWDTVEPAYIYQWCQTSRTTVSHSAAWWRHVNIDLSDSDFWSAAAELTGSRVWNFHFGQLSPSSPQNRWHGLPVNIRNLLDKRFSKKAEPISCLICRDIQAKNETCLESDPWTCCSSLARCTGLPSAQFHTLGMFLCPAYVYSLKCWRCKTLVTQIGIIQIDDQNRIQLQ